MLNAFFRPDLADLQPFTVPNKEGKISLHLNEAPFPPEIREKFQAVLAQELPYNQYGDPYAGELREAVAAYTGTKPENILFGNGSDELIYLLHLTFGGSNRRMVLPVPTFVSYQIYGTVAETELVPVVINPDFSLPVEKIIAASKQPNTSLVAICNPNNPTGHLFSPADLRQVIGNAASLVIVDEAYFEYSGQTVAPYLQNHPNLIILRTFSKAFSAAGIRIGYLLAHPQVITEMSKVKLPFNLGIFQQTIGKILLQNRELALAMVEKIKSERARVSAALAEIPGVKVFPSHTNFILISTPQPADNLWRTLYDRGIIVSNPSHYPLLENCLRIGIGTPEENNTLLAALKEILS
ncbi:MAG: histidinol-phosphate transaminase [bacterium]|jgi:histidinol-phosphate aminotransferase